MSRLESSPGPVLSALVLKPPPGVRPRGQVVGFFGYSWDKLRLLLAVNRQGRKGTIAVIPTGTQWSGGISCQASERLFRVM